MKQLNFYQYHPEQGTIEGTLRINGQVLFLKSSNAPQKNNMVAQLRLAGADIQESGQGWLKIDMFHTHRTAKLGEWLVDTEEMSQDKIEEILVKFYEKKYLEAKFEVVVKQL